MHEHSLIYIKENCGYGVDETLKSAILMYMHVVAAVLVGDCLASKF